MFTYENSIKEFGETLEALIKITECDTHTGIIYLQECNKENKQNLYICYTLENILSCISKNQLQWKKMSLSEQKIELDKELLKKT